MYCRECGQRLDNDALFCFHCGAGQAAEQTIQEMIQTSPGSLCAQCRAELEEGAAFCLMCGARQESVEAPATPEPEQPAEKAYCIQCGAELRQGAAFCVRCGAGRTEPPAPQAPPPEKPRCIQCGAELEEGAAFCLMCGAGQDDETPVMAPSLDTVSALPGETKKKGRKGFIALAAVLFLASATAAALLVARPWEAQEASAPAERGAPLQEAAPEETPAPEPTPAAGTELLEDPNSGTTMTITPTPTENTITFSPVTEQNYTIATFMNSRLKLSLGGSDPSGLCVKEIGNVADVLFYIKLVDENFGNGYHISSYHGNLQYIDGEPPTLNAVCREGLEDARWQFSRTAQNVYSIHLIQAPGYALAHEGERVYLVPYDEQDDRQQWIIEAPQPAPSLGAMETDELSRYILELSTRDITIEELYGLDEETVGYIRNGIYALAGKIFETRKYRDYFGSQSWYVPYSGDNELITARFNDHMEHNLNVCIEYEKLMGWR